MNVFNPPLVYGEQILWSLSRVHNTSIATSVLVKLVLQKQQKNITTDEDYVSMREMMEKLFLLFYVENVVSSTEGLGLTKSTIHTHWATLK